MLASVKQLTWRNLDFDIEEEWIFLHVARSFILHLLQREENTI